MVQTRSADMMSRSMHVKCGGQQSQVAYKYCILLGFAWSPQKSENDSQNTLLTKPHIQNNIGPHRKRSYL